MNEQTLGLLGIVGLVASVVSLVCWIITLVKMFQNAGVAQGILGIICGLWALIWGWQHAKELNLTQVMTAWTIAILISIAINVITVMNSQGVPGPVPAMLLPGW